MTISVQALFSEETAANILQRGLEIAQSVGLPVSTWRSGDPTRSLYKYLATVLANRESVTAEFIKAGFLSSASGDWLTVLAKEVFGVDRTEATYASGTITLHNGGGGFYPVVAGDLTFKCTATGKTFHNTTPGTLSAGATVVFTFVADEAGAASSVSAAEIDSLVTTLLGVTITANTAAVAQDEQSDDDLRVQCASTLGALSPDGPPDAYEYVVRNSALTGVTEITRAATSSNATNGTVTVYVASAAGTVSGPSVTATQNAVEIWATPLCIIPTVVSATTTSVNITANIHGTDIPGDATTQLTAAFDAFFAAAAIDGTGVARSRLIKLIHDTIPQIESVDLTVPAANVVLAIGVAPITGSVSIVEV